MSGLLSVSEVVQPNKTYSFIFRDDNEANTALTEQILKRKACMLNISISRLTALDCVSIIPLVSANRQG